MTAYDYLNWGTGTYTQGATKSTAGKPLVDSNIDKISPSNASKIRKQVKYLNVNGTDIPAMVTNATNRTIGVSVNIQVESENETFNIESEAFLKKFHKLGVGELNNKHHGNSAFRAISDFDLMDGGIIVRHHYLTAWAIPYKYELVPVDMIDVSRGFGRQTGKENYALNGLAYNKWNQLTHIYLYTNDDKTKSEKVSIKNITYYSDVWVSLTHQTAISKLSSILPKLDQIDQYAKAELDSAIEAAKAGAFLKSSAYGEIMNVLREEISRQGGTKQEKIDNAIDYAKPILDRLASIGIKPYGLTPIPETDSVEFDNRKRDGVFQELNDNSEMKMGAALGMSGMSVYSKADKANYSAMKYVSETDQLNADIRFDNIARKILDEINYRAIQVGVQIGKIKGRVDFWKDPRGYNTFRYLRQIHIDTEPAKNANANKTNLEIGIKTEAQIIEQRDGVPYEKYLEKEKESKKLKIKQKLELELYEKELRKEMDLGIKENKEGEQDG